MAYAIFFAVLVNSIKYAFKDLFLSVFILVLVQLCK